MQVLNNAHALVVGIARYQHLQTLPLVKDAEEIARLLTDPAHCGYLKENVQLLAEEQATGAAIRAGLARLAQRTGPDSMIWIYFSGHGGRVQTGPHTGEYLLPVDAVYPTDEDLARTAIAGTEFTAALNAIRARKALVLFDCCHSGGIGRPKNLIPAAEVKPGLSDAYYEGLTAGKGRVILASSRDTEYSYVPAGGEYGVFTRHLLDGLKGGAASADEYVRIFDLFEYLQPLVTRDHADQHPLFKGELEENFPVALYRGGQKGTVATDEQGFRYDAYVSYVDKEPDATWVWDVLLPRLTRAGLRVAISGDVDDPGVARVVSIERGLRQSKRTLLVLSDAYLDSNWADFENVLGQTMDIQEGTYRVLPIRTAPLDERRLPGRLAMLTSLDLTHPRRAEREFDRLVGALRGPLPRR